MEEKQLAVAMYHYIRDTRTYPFPGIHGITPLEFESQIKRLKEKYTFVSLNDVTAALKGEKALPARACLLSFDDGLKDHFEAFFILKKCGLFGVFFVITSSLEGRIADAHKLHFLMAKLSTPAIARQFNDFLDLKPKEIRDSFFLNDKQKIDPRYRFDDILTANLKATIQFLPNNLKSEFLNEMFLKVFGDESSFADSLYLSKNQIREMALGGMAIGSHTHSHGRLDKLSQNETEEELKKSKDILQEIISQRICALSYPYGNYNEQTVEIAKNLGYDIAFGSEVGINSGELPRYAIKRINANSI